MAVVEIYTTPFCPFCHQAKALLNKKGVDYTEIDVFLSRKKRAEMIERADGKRKVPQIFIDGKGMGGSDELYELEFDGELDSLLGLEA